MSGARLRHTAASLLLERGVHARVVMKSLGHSQISLTMNTYSHMVLDNVQAAIDVVQEALVEHGLSRLSSGGHPAESARGG